MKKFSPIIRFSLSCCVLSSLLFLAPQVQAATGECRPSGGTNLYDFDFEAAYSDPSQNVAGKTIMNANEIGKKTAWTAETTYPMICECQNGTYINESFITAEKGSGLGPSVYSGQSSDGSSIQYYKVDDYFAVAAEVYIAGGVGRYFPIPFTSVSNGIRAPNSHACNYNYGSGTRGKIHIYFIKPFVGSRSTDYVHIADVRIATLANVRSPQVAARVQMKATVTVQQNCDISPAPITIDFGDIMSSQFKTAGAMPDGFTPRNKVLTLACRNISDGVKVSLTFTADPDPKISNALKTTNGDIAVMIKDGNGNAISPSNGTLPINMTGLGTLNSSGQAEINVYPVNTTGNTPAVGVFNATGTVKVEIQ
ncbi:conserved exported hypothetical protein [Enterobacterales bacterium 8AC]|nr:conserved exported hypothetical protein [Enterobacterales bacterium 8AC]